MPTERFVSLLLASTLLAGCGTHTDNLAWSRMQDGSMPDAALDGELEPEPDAGPGMVISFEAGIVFCGNHRCQCSDGVNNSDNDELIDGFDPECTGAADDFEGHFGTGATGEDNDRKPCQDCFFDKNVGKDDGCSRPRACSTDRFATSNGNMCGGGGCSVAADSQCVATCKPLAPNGCDCFGCCSVYKALKNNGYAIYNVLLRASCSVEYLGDPAKCPSCVPAEDCLNPCDDCELCPGRTTVSASCASSRPLCPSTKTCTAASGCGASEYCLQGCCIPLPVGL
jgi:hypothetical protein